MNVLIVVWRQILPTKSRKLDFLAWFKIGCKVALVKWILSLIHTLTSKSLEAFVKKNYSWIMWKEDCTRFFSYLLCEIRYEEMLIKFNSLINYLAFPQNKLARTNTILSEDGHSWRRLVLFVKSRTVDKQGSQTYRGRVKLMHKFS